MLAVEKSKSCTGPDALYLKMILEYGFVPKLKYDFE